MSHDAAVPTIGIIGGGMAGLLIATQLLRDTRTPVRLRLFSPEAELGRGLAYSTANFSHRLNGPCKNFSLRPGEPLHFADWYSRRQRIMALPLEDVAPQQFAPRWVFGDYLRAQFAEALAEAAPGVRFEHVVAHINDVLPDGMGWQLQDDQGRRYSCDLLQLTLEVVPARPRMDISPHIAGRVLQGPWNPAEVNDLARLPDILLIGSGLTMLDAVVALEAAGFKGQYYNVSRRNLVPETRREVTPWPDFLTSYDGPVTARALFSRVRAELHRALESGEDWQRVVLAVRPHLHRLWRAASTTERRRFDRHVRAYWDIFLHRMPVPSAAVLQRVRAAGRIHFIPGRVQSLSAAGQRIATRIRARRDDRHITVDGVINCTGFEYDWRRTDSPLVGRLLARGLVTPSGMGAGIAACPLTQRVIGRDGQVHPRLYTSGVSLRGELYEAGTIGELLRQAVLLSSQLREHLSPLPAPAIALPTL